MILDFHLINGTFGMKNLDKIKVLVLGSSGMLGWQMLEVLSTFPHFEAFGASRKNLNHANNIKFDAHTDDLNLINNFDYIINCIGIIKPLMKQDIEKNIFINSIFPHKLEKNCLELNKHLIHITTDCVFSGKKGGYDEKDDHDPLDDYGKSKSLGETFNSMNIRTSIIGEEKFHSNSLIEWLKSNKGKSVNGFCDHYWNGVTTKHLSEKIAEIINLNLYSSGTFHIFSTDNITKYNLLNILNEKFNLGIKVNKHVSGNKIDRTLVSVHDLHKKIQIKSLDVQISEL